MAQSFTQQQHLAEQHSLAQKESREFKTTAGERVFEVMNYGVLPYIVGGVISVGLAHWALHPKAHPELPREFFQKFTNECKKFTKLYIDNDKKVMTKEGIERLKYEVKGEQLAGITALGSGGWALLIPMEVTEANKARITRGIDKTLGTLPYEDATVDEYKQHLGEKPQQNVVSLLAGRTTSFLATIFAFDALKSVTEVPVQKTEAVVESIAGEQLRKFRHGKVLPNYVAQEIVLSAIATGILYGSSNTVAYLKHRGFLNKDKGQARDITPPSQQVDAANLNHEPLQKGTQQIAVA